MHWYQLVHGSGSNSNFGGIEYFASVYFSRMEFKSRKSRKIVAREKYPVYSIQIIHSFDKQASKQSSMKVEEKQ